MLRPKSKQGDMTTPCGPDGQLLHLPPPALKLFSCTMVPLRTGTGAPVQHVNTCSDVGDHVVFGVDSPSDPFPVACCVIGRRSGSNPSRRGSEFGGPSWLVPQCLSVAPERRAGKNRVRSAGFHSDLDGCVCVYIKKSSNCM